LDVLGTGRAPVFSEGALSFPVPERDWKPRSENKKVRRNMVIPMAGGQQFLTERAENIVVDQRSALWTKRRY
jgi:hypothetical protein